MLSLIKTTYFLSLFLFKVSFVCSTEMLFEAENYVDSPRIMDRSNASNLKSAHLRQGDNLNMEFCLSGKREVFVADIVTSNSGNKDQITVSIDHYVQRVRTPQDNSSSIGWNNFISSGPLTGRITLLPGKHILNLNVTKAGQYGLEIDVVKLKVMGNIQSVNAFYCKVFCFDNIENTYQKRFETASTTGARIEQNSLESLCAEEDNVNIPFYFYNDTRYEIRAMHPKYKSTLNNRSPNFANCKMAKTEICFFKNVSIPSAYRTFKSGDATLFVASSDNKTELTIRFVHDLEEIGSDLRLKLLNIVEPMRIGMWFTSKRGEKSNVQYKTYEPHDEEMVWNIPDFTWVKGVNAVVGVVLATNKTCFVKELKLYPRGQTLDKSFKFFENDNIFIEAVKVDFWWKENNNFQITRTDTGKTYSGFHYIRFYARIPWSITNEYSQFFVLYSDGYARILPLCPQGLDWIPFGSSLLIGQSDPSLKRPSAAIHRLLLDPHRLSMTVLYSNHDIAFFDVHWTFDEAVLRVNHFRSVNNNLDLPILTFRSMWVEDGNSDVDSVMVDKMPSHSVLSNWGSLNGTSFTFYRRCLSKHNTQSPDLNVNILPAAPKP